MAGSFKYGEEPSGSGTTDLVNYKENIFQSV
jgi:hypothetical protein